MHFLVRAARLAGVAAVILCLSSVAWSQETDPAAGSTTTAAAESTAAPASKADVDAAKAEAASAGHTAWMLVSAALVLFMTVPGLAMFYGGLVRKKNVLSVMMQCIYLMGLLTVVWAIYGYSLSFGGVPGTDGYNPYVGNGDYLFMNNVQRRLMNGDEAKAAGIDPAKPVAKDEIEGVIPRPVHMLFQGMFFIITPALICGAFAERMKFSTMVVFMILWGTLVYCPLCHWVWDGGLLAYAPGGNKDALGGGALDFAGGTVVHISSGTSALICALLLGKRLGFGSEPMPPHNLTYTVLGAGMLWVGWFGFNAGSQLGSDGVAAQAFMNTHFSAAAGTIAWAGIEWILRGKPSVLGAASGAVAGLVCITPAAGFVQPGPAILMGIAAGLVCFWSCSWLKNTFKYDDSLDAFGVHGVGGTLGAILTGVFATKTAADGALWKGENLGLIDGNVNLFIGQLVAVAVTWLLSIVVTFVILKVLDAVMGLRVAKDEEQQGLDLTQHGEEGYIFL